MTAADLRGDRIYTCICTFNSGGQRIWRIEQPIRLLQVLVPRQVTLSLTNTQVKALDTTYHELVPAPGAGNTIEVMSWWMEIPGVDELTPGAGADPRPGAFTVQLQTYIGLIFVSDAAATNPLQSGEFVWLDTRALRYAFPPDVTWAQTIGSQQLVENTALTFGVVFASARSQLPTLYTPAAWADFWDGVDDRTIELTVNYRIHTAAPTM